MPLRLLRRKKRVVFSVVVAAITRIPILIPIVGVQAHRISSAGFEYSDVQCESALMGALVFLALFPGQALMAPTVNSAALMLIVKFALKALVNMENTAKIGLDQCFACFMRAFAASANQYDR
jgi:hypothetical protein